MGGRSGERGSEVVVRMGSGGGAAGMAAWSWWGGGPGERTHGDGGVRSYVRRWSRFVG